MKVTLRKFLEITGKEFIRPWCCLVYVDQLNQYLQEYFPAHIKFQRDIGWLCDIDNLEQYMDYEIYAYDQELCWGQLETQYIYLKKIEVNANENLL